MFFVTVSLRVIRGWGCLTQSESGGVGRECVCVCASGGGVGPGGGAGSEGRCSQLGEVPVQGEEMGEGGRAEEARAASPSPQIVPG